ncbi:ABC transporter ATP-binding protein [Actinomadura soli]|uniref:ABC transporter ATP-binding protein n=1 Tax=Actinomadura soli TaxID=2508997 RepID=A0A5C4JG26_9ACTN|nr:ABC transporter ATP-binding protein [Actinomadura soli]TMR04309.1 ABC transporter ATP-binding protein [Actinomadura soli]
MTVLLEASNLSVNIDTPRGDLHVVEDVSFSLGEGEILGVVGESGCGKSTTVRSLIGLLPRGGRVTGGSALFDGVDLFAQRPASLRAIRGDQIGFVAQNPFGLLNPVLPIAKQFRTLIRAHRGGLGKAECASMAREALLRTGIHEPDRVLHGYAHQLSGGMAQRVVIAMATILDPRLLISDEPTTALDVTIQRQVLELMRDVVRLGNRSMILVTHDLGVVAQFCDSVIVMYSGSVVESGKVAEVFTHPEHPYTRGLLASVPGGGRGETLPPGGPPARFEPARGCQFAPRCSRAETLCSVEPPPTVSSLGGDRRVRCHFVEIEEATHGAPAG